MKEKGIQPKTYEELLEQLSSNRKVLNKSFANISEIFEKVFNIQQSLFYSNIPGILDPYYELSPTNQIVIQGYIKSSHLLLTSYELTLYGNQGASLILLRQVLEFLLLAKYAIATKDYDLAKKWLDGRQVDVYKTVIKRIRKPSKKEFFELWKILSDLNHATTNSYQISFNLKQNKDSLYGPIIIILMLHRCNYHLLNSHLIDHKLRYRNKVYYNPEECSQWRKEVRPFLKKIKNMCSLSGNKFITDYESKWEFSTI